jgi:hypothetical protein
VKPPMARAMSAATDGFSAMISALDMQKSRPPTHGGLSLYELSSLFSG